MEIREGPPASSLSVAERPAAWLMEERDDCDDCDECDSCVLHTPNSMTNVSLRATLAHGDNDL